MNARQHNDKGKERPQLDPLGQEHPRRLKLSQPQTSAGRRSLTQPRHRSRCEASARRKTNRLKRCHVNDNKEATHVAVEHRQDTSGYKPTSQYMMPAIEKSAMFLVSCIATFLDRAQGPASSMAKPAAIQNTRKPAHKEQQGCHDDSRLLVQSGRTSASCAIAAAGRSVKSRCSQRRYVIFFVMISSFPRA